MIGHKCNKCIWWDNKHKNVPIIDVGFCRKHKPAATMKDGLYMGIWPLTDKEDFCGEFRGDK